LIQRQLFAQKKVFGGQGSGWTETEPQEAQISPKSVSRIQGNYTR
jgi:hypothetical protein